MKGTIELVMPDKNSRYKLAIQKILTTKIMRIKG